MSDLILHHYPASPFSEKVRLILGAKKLAWKSVHIPMVMPKPDVLALTGGYRRTPFLQIGADIYCDTALICDVLEHRQPLPSLYPAAEKGVARIVAQWADSTLFWAAMAYSLQPKGAASMWEGAPPEALKAFAADRGAMSQGMTRLRPADATGAYKSYLRRIAHMLEQNDFLLGDAPCVADFAVYHPLWFTRHRTPAVADIFQATPVVLDWMDRMAALGHGAPEKMSAADAIAMAKASNPAVQPDAHFQDDHGIALGSRVGIAAESFGLEVTEGELVASTRTQLTLRRVDERAGTVHVHFPRAGYVMRALA